MSSYSEGVCIENSQPKGSRMNRFRTKPVEVEAIQNIYASNAEWIAAWTGGKVGCAHEQSIFIPTIQGVEEVKYNDWIIKSADGRFMPCSQSRFALIYDAIDELVWSPDFAFRTAEAQSEGGLMPGGILVKADHLDVSVDEVTP